MATKPNPEFMQRAIDLARDNVKAGTGGPFAALIVREGKVIAEAANSVTSTNDPTAHGEINAIRKACVALASFTLDRCEIYTSCEPCPMCLAAIYWARLAAIYYGASQQDAARAGFDDAHLYSEIRKQNGEREIPSTRVLADESRACFEDWLAMEARIHY